MEDRERMIEQNLPLARHVALKSWRRCRGLHLDYGDFLAWASVGLIHAVDNYDAEKNTTFGTYAYHCITMQILSGMDEFRGIKRSNRRSIEQTRAFQRRMRQFPDWAVPRCDDRGPKAVDDRDEVRHALSRLNDRDRECLTLLYLDGKSYDELGHHFGVCRQRVFQIRDQALRRLRAQAGGECSNSLQQP